MDREEKIHALRQELEEMINDWHAAEDVYALKEVLEASEKLRNAEALMQWEPDT